MSVKLSPPRAPTDQLRLESFRVLSRLLLITELRPWLGSSSSTGTPGSAFQTLWTCLSLGAPLCALLNMLAPPYIDVDVDYDLPLDGRMTFFTNFIERVKLLEMQGRLTYGEVLRVDDMYGETCTGFAKVLKTVQRVLVALQGTCPDLYVAPPRAEQQRRAFVQSLLDTEEIHVSSLGSVAEAALLMSTATGTVEPRLECLLVNRSHLREYHSQVLAELQQISNSPWLEDWIKVFGTNKPAFITRTVSAYRSICVNCLPIHEFLIKQLATIDPELRGYAQTLLDIVGRIPARLAEYCANLSAILRVSTPSAHHSYDSLCSVVFRMQDASDTIDEMSRQIRTMRCSSILKARAFLWDPDSPSETGSLLLDDTLLVSEIGLSYSLFLFDTVLLCCLEEIGSECKSSRYPVEPWELGPALKGTSMLSLAHSIPTQAIRQVYVFKSESFSILWVDPRGEENVLEFTTTCPAQNEQWCSLLSRFADMIYSRDDERDDAVSVDSGLEVNYRRRSRPWSVRGHKSSNSQASSTMQSDFGANDLVLSPGMLPTLFNNGALSKSPPFSLDSSTGSRFEAPPTPPPDFVPVDLTSVEVMDLTGNVKKEGRFSVAGGGFSDVFKGVWRDASQERQVAIKVLRSRTDDPETESRIRQRLARELSVWKKINHPNILQLYGTVSDFGNYDSMVCPWFENGSVTKYLERRGDLLSMTDRLQLLIQVAEGLSYLHSLGIVHGDLTGSNILINDKGEAVLCDFGLSNMLAVFQGSSSSCMSSTIGGAIRWADASLYRLSATDEEDPEEDATTEPPFLTPPSDIYSFGSVTLEILSGRIPYHYVRSDAQVVIELHRGRKPRRPAVSFVTEAQWKFIERCWSDAMEDRPDALEVLATIQCLYKASLDFRRHSAP